MIRLFPQLEKLDDREISDRERRDAARLSIDASRGAQSASDENHGDIGVSTSPMKRSPSVDLPPAQVRSRPETKFVEFADPPKQINRNSMPPGAQKQRPQEPTSSDEEDLRLQLELLRLQRQRRRATSTGLPVSNNQSQFSPPRINPDERPLTPARMPIYSSNFGDDDEHLIGQGVIGTRREQRLQKPGMTGPSYDSKILRDKQFQDHLAGAGRVVERPVVSDVDNRFRSVAAGSTANGGGGGRATLAGTGAVVRDAAAARTDFRMRDSEWTSARGHLSGAGMHVAAGATAAVGAGDGDVDFRIRTVDYRPRGEQHLVGAMMAVEDRVDVPNARIAAADRHAPNQHVVGSGVRVVDDDDLEFQVVEVLDTARRHQRVEDSEVTVKARKPAAVAPVAVLSKQNGMLTAILGVVKELDRPSLEVLSMELARLLER
ncbi:hypothetical protein HDU84_002217 [Entophlyctis sp. JEL0112]|nr:hypothetical protein HDU84_002217 [Entophlyctis sp. JEL0112]